MTTRSIDLLALASAVLAAIMAVAYVAIVHSQGDGPLLWVIAALLLGAVLAAYGASRRAPRRQLALVAAALLLGLLGLLAILTIGIPILLAALLALLAAVRTPRPVPQP